MIAACKQGLKLLQSRQQTHAQLGQPWAMATVLELKKGLALLENIDRETQQLSVRYSEQVEQLNVNQLQRESTKAEKALWPLSWLAKRTIRKALDAVVSGEGEPDVAKDLRAWVEIRALRSQATALDLGTGTDGLWAGLKTQPDLAQCALRFQMALSAARNDQPWQDTGFEPIADGRCGERLAAELARLRKLHSLDSQLAALDHLGPATESLWAGLATRTEALEAALRFQSAKLALRESGSLTGRADRPAQCRGGWGLRTRFGCGFPAPAPAGRSRTTTRGLRRPVGNHSRPMGGFEDPHRRSGKGIEIPVFHRRRRCQLGAHA